MAIFAFSVSSSGMYTGMNPNNTSEHNVAINWISTENGFTNIKAGKTNFIGE
ncbi:hypothetical protein ACNF40_00985 [Cuniculiplasma sp. SKW4]